MKRVRHLTLCFAISLLLCIKVQAQLISEGFENDFPPAGWAIKTYTPNSNGWYIYYYQQHSGQYSAACFANSTVMDSWLFSSGVTLQAGKSYQLKYWVNKQPGSSLRITLNTSQQSGAVFQTVRSQVSGTPNTFVEFIDTITCEASGTYYIGFHDNSRTTLQTGLMLDDITLSPISQPDCAVVSAGTVNASVTAICPGVNFTLHAAGPTTNTNNIRYSWQKSVDNITWENITNSYEFQPSLQITQTAASYYRLTDTCLFSGTSSVSNSVRIDMNPFMDCYCSPWGGSCGPLYFTNITFPGSSINNNSTCAFGLYTNYKNIGAATAYRNQPLLLRHTVNNTISNSYRVGVWVDSDHSGTFDEDEFTLSYIYYGTTATSQVIIPADALTGETMIRVRVRQAETPEGMIYASAACAISVGGETEDYRINIVGDAPACAGSVSAGTISGPTQLCPNTPFVLTVNNATVNQNGMRYAWQRSANNTDWADISNTSTLLAQVQLTQNQSYFYRMVDTCIATGTAAISNVVNVVNNNVFDCYCRPTLNNYCTTISIDSVSFNTIQNPSGCGTGGYSNFTAFSTDIGNGSTVPLYIRFKQTTAQKYVIAWIDFNRNGILEEAEKVLNTSTTGNFVQSTVVVPHNVIPGEVLMRIIARSSSFYNSCDVSSSSAEIEDYKINITGTRPADAYFSYYVNSSATGANNGSSWADAFTSLNTALELAKKYDTIRVAKGVYKPGSARTDKFVLKDSVIILGGYPSTGNPGDGDRNFSLHQTIISGEIGGSGYTDNTDLLLYTSGIRGFLLDGFIIERGYSYSSSVNGPVYFHQSTGTLRNTVFRNNFSRTQAAALTLKMSTISLENSIVENNQNEEFSYLSSAITALDRSTLNIINCVIAKNRATYIIDQQYSTVNLINSTIFKNMGITNVRDTSRFISRNSILYGNSYNIVGDTVEIARDYLSTASILNSIVQAFHFDSIGFNGQDPKFIDTLNIAGADNLYFTADDGLHLLNPCSPAINAGDNSFVNGLATDITGNPRIRNGNVDLGAYEMQEALAQTPAVIYVNRNATGANDGTSWQNAFTNLQQAFNNCSDTIKIARGIYPVSATDRFASFSLSNKRVVMGGFPDSGNPTNADFNPELHRTVLSGLMTGNERVITVVASRNNDSTAHLIGVTIADAGPPSYSSEANSTGIRITNKSNPVFKQVQASAASNLANKLLIVDRESKPLFESCTFFTNFSASGAGENRSLEVRRKSIAVFHKTFIGADTTLTITGARRSSLQVLGATVLIDSCSFRRTGNRAVSVLDGEAIISNTVFARNIGRSISAENSRITVYNATFRDTTHAVEQSGGTLGHSRNTTAVYVKCRFEGSFSYYNASVALNESSDISFEKCVFANGVAEFSADVMLLTTGGSLKLSNCLMYSLKGPDHSYTGMIGASDAQTTMINSTIVGGFSEQALVGAENGSLKIYNCIVWRTGNKNAVTDAYNVVNTSNNNNAAQCDIRNSILHTQKNTLLTNSMIGVDPKLLNIQAPEGGDYVFYTDDDGFKPCSCSPAVNAGDNTLTLSSTDILSFNRIRNNTVDIGAYEIQEASTLVKSFYVNASAQAGGNGVSWATAYRDLQSAMQNACADTIHVAAGVYKPAVASRDSSFHIYAGKTMLGSYPATGNPTESDRNIHLHPSILSGDIGIPNDSTDNSFVVLLINSPDTSVTIDGFVVEKGVANRNQAAAQPAPVGGGGIRSLGNKNLTIRNCIIRNNYGHRGGGLASFSSNITINKTVFESNNALTGGAFQITDDYTVITGNPWTTKTVVANSVIANNHGTGAVFTGRSGPTALLIPALFENVIFYRNEGSEGGALQLSDNPYVHIKNCAFVANNTLRVLPGVAIHVTGLQTTNNLATFIYNTLFKGNTVVGISSSNNDFNFSGGNVIPGTVPANNMQYSGATSTFSAGTGNFSGVEIKDINNGPGADQIWMTDDDGIAPVPCAKTIDRGGNQFSQAPLDIRDSVRIANHVVDVGPYEMSAFKVDIIASDSAICPGTSVTFTATALNAGVNPTYQWEVNGVNTGTNAATFTSSSLVNNDRVRVKVKTQNCAANDTAYSNIIVMRVGTSALPTVRITATDTTFCAGTPVTFSADAVGANTNTIYQWKVNGANVGTNSKTYTSAAFADNDLVQVEVQVNNPCLANPVIISNTQKVHVNIPIAPSVAITGPPGPVCEQSMVTYKATATDAGVAPVYQWKVNGINVGENSPVYSTAQIHNDDEIMLVMNSSEKCPSVTQVTSNIIIQQVVAPVMPEVNINAGPMTCAGVPVTFTASAVNAGTVPYYTWLINGAPTGVTGNNFTSSDLSENDVVEAVVTANISCVAQGSSTIPVHFVSGPPPSVNIAATTTNICAGSPVTFTATAENGGTAPIYQWKVNGVDAGNNSPVFTINTLTNGSIVTVSLTSSTICGGTATSNAIVITVNNVSTPTVTVTTPNTTVCSGTAVEFTAAAVNAGILPSYQWQVNGNNVGNNDPSFVSSTLASGDRVGVILTSNANCATPATVISNIITITVTQTVTPSVTINTSATAICSGSATTFDATPVNGGNTPSYQWKINGSDAGTSGSSFTSATLSNADQVSVIMTSNAACATTPVVTSNTIAMTVTPVVTPSVSIGATTTDICSGASLTFIATPVNEGTSPSYQWQVNGTNVGNNSSSFTTTTLANNDQVRVIMTSSASCVTNQTATSNVITVTVNPAVAPVVTISTPVTLICAGASTTFTATPSNGGPAPSYQWQVNGTNVGNNSSSFTTTTLANNDQVRVIMTSNASCVTSQSATSNVITVNLNTAAAPAVTIGTSVTTICSGSGTTFTATPVNGGTSPSYQWQINGTNVGNNSSSFTTTTLANNDQVRVIMTSSATCAVPATATSNTITMTVNQSVTPVVSIGTPAANICPGSSITFTATPSNGGTAPSYQWQVNGVNVGNNSSSFTTITLTATDQVRVIMTSNAPCTTNSSATSNVLSLSMAPVPSITISGTTTVERGISTLLSSQIAGSGTNTAYQWQDSTSSHTWQDIAGAVSSTYSYSPANSDDKARCLLTATNVCGTPVTAISNVLKFIVIDGTVSGRMIRYYPNPVNSLLTVDSIRLTDKWETLEILTTDGRRVIAPLNISNQTSTQINVSTFINGLYTIVLRRKDGRSEYVKFMKF